MVVVAVPAVVKVPVADVKAALLRQRAVVMVVVRLRAAQLLAVVVPVDHRLRHAVMDRELVPPAAEAVAREVGVVGQSADVIGPVMSDASASSSAL